jgi:5-methylcytosine-specific restriction enzyme subunit McrC
MRHLRLVEHQTTPGVELTPAERDVLRPIVQLAPTPGEDNRYDLTPGSRVGVVQTASLTVQIQPKIPVSRLMFLLSYTIDRVDWDPAGFDFAEDVSLLEAMIHGFVLQTRKALRRGALQGYRLEEDALTTVRGQIRFGDQLRARYGVAPPVEVRFDDFTEDIEPNRLIKAAIRRLGMMRIRSEKARLSLRNFDHVLERVADVTYDPRNLPDIRWDRLNAHYRPAVELAKLVLRSASFELDRGGVRSAAFLVDMNQVFEDFVVVALREALGASSREFRQGDASLRLDQARRVRLEPDLSWWRHGRCVFVGDVKYKKVRTDRVNHPDLYQLLAYVVAAGLPAGLLVYAAGEDEPATHDVVHLSRRLRVETLDLSGHPGELLAQIRKLADAVRSLANQALVCAAC